MVTVIRPSRARCVKGRIPRHDEYGRTKLNCILPHRRHTSGHFRAITIPGSEWELLGICRRWEVIMSRVIAVMACGFMLAACSTAMPSLDFMKSAPQAESLAIESEPPGAEANTSLGQSCRTPCQLSVQPGSEFSVTLARTGYQAQTVSVRPEAEGATAAPASRPTRFTWTCRQWHQQRSRLRRKRSSWRPRPVQRRRPPWPRQRLRRRRRPRLPLPRRPRPQRRWHHPRPIIPGRRDSPDSRGSRRLSRSEERLGVKASDEQRIDNCKAPLDRRGPQARLDECDDGASTGRETTNDHGTRARTLGPSGPTMISPSYLVTLWALLFVSCGSTVA